MKNYREILIQITFRFLVAIPFLVLGWYLIATARGGWIAISQLFFAMACFVVFAAIVGPSLAKLFAEPAGSLYYSTSKIISPQPDYTVPEMKKAEGLYEEALSEYEKITMDFPEEVKPYIEMMDIAVVNLRDPDRADAIYRKGLSVLRDDEDRDLLTTMHQTVTSELTKDLFQD